MFEYTRIIHQLATQLPRIALPVEQEVETQAGIIFIFDRLEPYYEFERIVYVGYSGNMSRRWRQIFYGKTQSNIRGYLQTTLSSIDEIEMYMHKQFYFTVLECPNENLAKQYAQQICTLLQSDPNFQPSEQWLGHQVVKPPLTETKLWQNFAPQSQELNSQLLESLVSLLEMQSYADEQLISRFPDDETTLKQLAQNTNSKVRQQMRLRKEWIRNPYVRAYTLQQAQGRCQLCEQPAPFRLPDGTPFLEVHHIIPLESGGPDTIENCVALCPNCHREVHYAANKFQREYLNSKQKVTKD